jgi:hypothetical protein
LNQAIVAAVRELVIMEVVANMVKLDHLCFCKLIRNVKIWKLYFQHFLLLKISSDLAHSSHFQIFISSFMVSSFLNFVHFFISKHTFPFSKREMRFSYSKASVIKEFKKF